ncbi:MAG: ABC transporter permease [Actinomycetota bacterium]|nr:ABC transporter permease [Actinomycetota bacterium]
MNSLRANKMRSALTMLGVIIGVSSVILLVALGSGARAEITQALQGLGSNLIMVVPFKINLTGAMTPESLMQMGSPTTTANKLTLKTVDEIAKAIGDPKRVSPIIQRQSYIIHRGRKKFMLINATTEKQFDVRKLKPQSGRFFSQAEVNSAKTVVVLGPSAAKSLFGDEDPVGRYIEIKGRRFKIVGIHKSMGTTMGMIDLDSFAWIPITTCIRMYGKPNPDTIMVEAKSQESVEKEVAEIKKTLSKEFSSDEVSVITQKDILSIASDATRIMTYLLGGLGGISLLVGGIGIMNIMLVSVTERTREIGIRKAVGAKTRDIMLQFLIESIILSLIGGAIGVALSSAGASIYEAIFHIKAQVTIWIILLAFVFSMMVGIFFGVYPARKASLLDPIEALRYE